MPKDGAHVARAPRNARAYDRHRARSQGDPLMTRLRPHAVAQTRDDSTGARERAKAFAPPTSLLWFSQRLPRFLALCSSSSSGVQVEQDVRRLAALQDRAGSQCSVCPTASSIAHSPCLQTVRDGKLSCLVRKGGPSSSRSRALGRIAAFVQFC
eukprot:4599918-Pleurochrysis_carterae.AAC.1